MNTLSFEAPRALHATAQIIPFPRRTSRLPMADYGSGWYHEAAIAEERDAKARSQPTWHAPHGRA